MTKRLREFVYLNEMSLNNHLSSLGEGIPEEITQVSGSETETSGEAKIGVPQVGLGGGGRRSYLDTDNLETRLRVSSPYHFQRLRELLQKEEIPVKDAQDSLERGDVVEISGDVSAMSLFRFEIVLSAFLSLMNQETHDSLEQLQNGEQDVSEDLSMGEIEQVEQIRELVRHFSGGEISVRTISDGNPFGIPLKRDHMRGDPARVFLENREYTIFGRVESILGANDQWDPATVTNVLDKYVPQEQAGEEFRSYLKIASRDLDMNMEDEDMLIKGSGCILHPIAVYW